MYVPDMEDNMYCINTGDKDSLKAFADQMTTRLWEIHKVQVDPIVFCEVFQAIVADGTLLLRGEEMSLIGTHLRSVRGAEHEWRS